MAGPVYVRVDWNRDGDYADPLENVSDYVRGSVQCSFGRDQATALSPVAAGRGSFDLDNKLRYFSPRNASSPITGKVKPARPVTISRDVTVGAVTTNYVLFKGHTDAAPINPDIDKKTVSLTLVDTLADFRGVNIATELWQGLRSGDAINKVLDAAGWTGARDIDTGASIFPWWWADGKDAFTALSEILASEGPPSLLTIDDATGGVVFRDREHRLVRTASKTSQGTWRGTGAIEPVMGKGFAPDEGWQNIVNSIMFDVNERIPTSGPVNVWSSTETITIGASASVVVVISTSDPFWQAVTPDVGGFPDFEILTGSITSVTLSRDSGASTSLTFTAGGGGAVIQNVNLRAYSVPVARTYQVSSTDSASITDYGQRAIPSGMEPTWCSRSDAKSIADLLVLQRKQPLTVLTVRFSCGHMQANRLTAVLARNLSDRVTIIEPESQINGDFFIESITHTITDMTNHEIVFGLEAVPAAPTSVFIIGTSLLDGSDLLGY